MQIGNNTSTNLFQNETIGTFSGQLAAFPNWTRRVLLRGLGTLLLWARRSRQRSELRRVMSREDRFFLDIGVSRATLHHEARKWFWQG